MIRKTVVSSNIKSIGAEGDAMEIEFSNGHVYRYSGPRVQQHFHGLISAKSIGTHFARYVRSCPDTKCEPVAE